MKHPSTIIAILKYASILILIGTAVYFSNINNPVYILIYISIFLFVVLFDFICYKKPHFIKAADECAAVNEIREANIEASNHMEALDYLNGNPISEEKGLNVFIDKISNIRNELKMKNEELQALREASEIITSTFDVKTIIEYIYKVYNRFTACDRYLICFADKQGSLTYKYEFGSVILNEIGNIVDKDSVISKCFKKGKTILNTGIFISSRGIYGDKIATPLNIAGETVGAILMETSEAGSFEKINLGFVESLAAYVAIAIKNAELFGSIYNQKQEIEALYEETAAVNEELNIYIDELGKTKEELKSKNEELNGFYSEIKTGYIQTVMALSNSIEAKDAYTRGHCQRVMEISCEIGKKLGLNDDEIQDLRYVAILHDIGKIGIPASILNKKEKLTYEEFDEIKRHPQIAYNILKDVEFIKNGLNGILQHHERFDGKGYPYGIKGKDICRFGRILCVADAFDAMTTDRPYRKGMAMEDALKEIEKCKGTQFDPEIADLFISMSR